MGDKAKVLKAQLKKSELFALWDFKPGECELPPGVQENDPVKIRVVGEYKDTEVNVWVVQVNLKNGRRLARRPNRTILHIVKWNKDGVNPVVASRRLNQDNWTRLPLSRQFTVDAIAYFKRV